MNLRSLNPVKLIFILMFLILVSSCARVSTTSKDSNQPPKTPPSHVVSEYLDALKRGDYGKTYEFISSGYAANLDLESYKENMKQSLQKFSWRLLGYQILGVQVLGDQAIVVAELDVQFIPVNSSRETQKKTNVQYGLTAVDKKWKISGSNCISNCVSREDFAGQSLNQ